MKFSRILKVGMYFWLNDIQYPVFFFDGGLFPLFSFEQTYLKSRKNKNYILCIEKNEIKSSNDRTSRRKKIGVVVEFRNGNGDLQNLHLFFDCTSFKGKFNSFWSPIYDHNCENSSLHTTPLSDNNSMSWNIPELYTCNVHSL